MFCKVQTRDKFPCMILAWTDSFYLTLSYTLDAWWVDGPCVCRERLSKCQSKYMSMQTSTSSVHRALRAMRREGERMLQKPSEEAMRRKSSFKGNWWVVGESIGTQLATSVWFGVLVLLLSPSGHNLALQRHHVNTTKIWVAYGNCTVGVAVLFLSGLL